MADEQKQPRPGWYVVQVTTGNEDRMCALIERACKAYDARLDVAAEGTAKVATAPGAPRPATASMNAASTAKAAAASAAAAKPMPKAKPTQVGLKECFNPRFASRRKRKGEWQDVKRNLLPGYVVADVQNPASLAQALRPIRDFCRLITNGETYAPLDEAEREWLESQTRTDDRVVPMSFAYKEGDKLFVTDGPLEGNEAMITKFDRKNCLAHIELHMGQMTIRTTIGLVVMPSGKVRQVAS